MGTLETQAYGSRNEIRAWKQRTNQSIKQFVGKRDEEKIAHQFNAPIQRVSSICRSSDAQESVPVVSVGSGVPDRAG